MRASISKLTDLQVSRESSSGLGICTLFCSDKFLNYHRKSKRFTEYEISGVTDSSIDFHITLTQESTSEGDFFTSHGGAPYGGICVNFCSPEEIANLYSDIWDLLRTEFSLLAQLEVRLPPCFIGPEVQSHEWALWSLGFKQEVGYLGRYFQAQQEISLNRNRFRSLKKAKLAGGVFRLGNVPSQDAFDVLIENRLRRHETSPTHTYTDLIELNTTYPGCITSLEIETDSKVQAVAIIFGDKKTQTLQYLANSVEAAENGLQDLLVYELLTEVRNVDVPFILGTSTDPITNHRSINSGLDRYKSSWGAIPYSAFRYVKSVNDFSL